MGKVRIGFFSFTEVTDPAEHRSYNEWHQLDHMPEQYPLPGLVFGQRWVSTPACRRAREYDAEALASIHYMTLYLMGEPVATTLEEFWALGGRLRAAGRFHEHRRSHLSGPLTLTGTLATPRVLVSADAVPYRPNRGVYVVVRDTAVGGAEGDGDNDDAPLAHALLEHDGVAGIWSFTTDVRYARHRWKPGHKMITVCYLDADPVSVASGLGDQVRAVAEGEGLSILFAGPLETITPWCWDWFDDSP
jgi:hypothetical protein